MATFLKSTPKKSKSSGSYFDKSGRVKPGYELLVGRASARARERTQRRRQREWLGPIIDSLDAQRKKLTEAEKKALAMNVTPKPFTRGALLRSKGISGLVARRRQQQAYQRAAAENRRKALEAIKTARQAIASQESQARARASRIR